MLGLQRYVIAQHERAFLYRSGRFEAVLTPGVYSYLDPLGRLTVERFDLNRPAFSGHRLEDYFLQERPDLVEAHFQVVEVGPEAVGLVYHNERLVNLLPPRSRQLFWRGPTQVRVDTTPLGGDLRVPKDVAVLLRDPRHPFLRQALVNAAVFAEVGQHQVGLLFVDGALRETLSPGVYAFWGYQNSVKVELIDVRLQPLEVSGQEILTKDKVSLRVNLSASYRVVDPVVAREGVANFKDFLYRELQFALRWAVGNRTLEELLTDKERVDAVVNEAVVPKVAEHGLELKGVGIKDVILPGEMRTIFNQVVEAEKAAQANVIKRREETAATRSLLNTAKLMEENPLLLRLKELEMLEKVTDKVESLTVFGGLEGVLQELVKIRPNTVAGR
ncbi:MAG: slipin family protein [Candidatus Competibacterales bacterium]